MICRDSSLFVPRIAVAGAGMIGRAHIAVIAASPQCRLSALVDPSPAAQGLADQLGVPCYRDLGQLLAHDRPDGVVLATPNPLHVPQAQQCIAAAMPVLLEKPIATTMADGQQLVDQVARTAGAKVLIGHHRAHSPIMVKACEVVASGQLGQVVGVMGSAAFFKPDHYFEEGPWRRERGGGPILLNMIHEVHNLRMLCGDIVAVQAFKSNQVRGFAVEDTVAINLRFASGALGTFLLSDTAACARSWEQTSQENQAYASYGDEDCYVIAGTRGSLSVPTMRLKTYPSDDARSWWQPFDLGTVNMVREDPLVRQMNHFVKVIQGLEQPRVSVQDGLLNLQVTEAIQQAAETGALVTLPPLPEMA